MQIYLTEEVDLAHGHTIYLDSPWALTSISQGQFWEDVDLSQYGNGSVKGIISIDISEWEEKGLNGKTAKDCDPQELTQEVWEQLKRSLNHGSTEVLKDEYLYQWFLDPDVQLRDEAADTNEEPLLVNLVDTWKLRPEAVTRIHNLFLAADYVRTHTDPPPWSSQRGRPSCRQRDPAGFRSQGGAVQSVEAARTGDPRTLARPRSGALPARFAMG